MIVYEPKEIAKGIILPFGTVSESPYLPFDHKIIKLLSETHNDSKKALK